MARQFNRTRMYAIPPAVRALARDRRGATAIEYALIAGFLSIAIAVTVQEIGAEVVNFFTNVKDGFSG